MSYARINNLDRLKTLRKELRNHSSPAEITLWLQLKGSKLGQKFRRQHSVGNYILDFYCPELKLAVELDGQSHDNPGAYEYDQARTEFLQKQGIKVIRYLNKDVVSNLDGVLSDLKKQLL